LTAHLAMNLAMVLIRRKSDLEMINRVELTAHLAMNLAIVLIRRKSDLEMQFQGTNARLKQESNSTISISPAESISFHLKNESLNQKLI
jgi:hypothetical protein